MLCCTMCVWEARARLHVNVTIRDSEHGVDLVGLAAGGYDLVSVSETYELGEVMVEIDVVPTPLNDSTSTPVPVEPPPQVVGSGSTGIIVGGSVAGVVAAGGVLAVILRGQQVGVGVGIAWPRMGRRAGNLVPFRMRVPAGVTVREEGGGTGCVHVTRV